MPSRLTVYTEDFDVNINDIAVGGFTRTSGGMVTRWGVTLTSEVKRVARRLTLAGTTKYGRGGLANDYSVVLTATGESHCTIVLKNRKSYAKYVFEGTRPVITNSRLMPVGKSQLGLGAIRAPKGSHFSMKGEVKGQVGHNYPMQAVGLVFTRRGIF